MIETPSFRLPEGPAIWHDPATGAWYFWGEDGGPTFITDYLAQTEPEFFGEMLWRWCATVCAKRHLKIRPLENAKDLETELVEAALAEERAERRFEAWCDKYRHADPSVAAREDNGARLIDRAYFARRKAAGALLEWREAEEQKREITRRRQAEGLR